MGKCWGREGKKFRGEKGQKSFEMQNTAISYQYDSTELKHIKKTFLLWYGPFPPQRNIFHQMKFFFYYKRSFQLCDIVTMIHHGGSVYELC